MFVHKDILIDNWVYYKQYINISKRWKRIKKTEAGANTLCLRMRMNKKKRIFYQQFLLNQFVTNFVFSLSSII